MCEFGKAEKKEEPLIFGCSGRHMTEHQQMMEVRFCKWLVGVFLRNSHSDASGNSLGVPALSNVLNVNGGFHDCCSFSPLNSF